MTRRIILVSHCLLNVHSKVSGSGVPAAVGRSIAAALLAEGFGIIQLPCPELAHGGLSRWGQSRSQYDNVFFRAHCRRLAEDVANQLEEYVRGNYAVGPVLGINGSPSCGIDFCFDGSWGGELGDLEQLPGKIEKLKRICALGVFMEVLRDELAKRQITVDWIGVNEEEPELSLSQTLKLLGVRQ